MSTYIAVGQPRTDVATCDICCRPARKAIVIRDEDGSEIFAADRCAKLLLGYNPFTRAA